MFESFIPNASCSVFLIFSAFLSSAYNVYFKGLAKAILLVKTEVHVLSPKVAYPILVIKFNVALY